MNKKIFIITIFSLLIDQISKIIVDNLMSLNQTVKVISGFFYLTKVNNTGAAFSILEGRTFLLGIVSIFTIFVLIRYMNDFKTTYLGNLSFGLLLGGIFGNFSDRVFLGSVRDFLKFNIFGYTFPVFNIADVCIVLGVALLIICIFRGDDKSENHNRQSRRAKKTR